MRAAFHDLAVVEHQHLVGVADGAQPVGDDEAGAALPAALQGRLDQPLGARVHAGRGFVQDQDARVRQRGAGDGDQLALALAQAAAALAQHRVVPVGQPLDEAHRPRQRRRGHHLLVGRVRPAKADVVHHRVAEQEGSPAARCRSARAGCGRVTSRTSRPSMLTAPPITS